MKPTVHFTLALALSSTIAVQSQTSAPSTRQAPMPSVRAVRLNLADAEKLAIQHNPRIAVGRLLALAQNQVMRETRSAEMPIVTGNLTAVDSHESSRITAGSLNNPIVYQRAAGGITLSQLITDFGRTRNLVSSADLRARAEASAADATAADIILAVDIAYYRALGAQSVLDVANEAVKARQATVDQIAALAFGDRRKELVELVGVDLGGAAIFVHPVDLILVEQEDAAEDQLGRPLGIFLGIS